jgi:hypothetical protein
VLPASRRTRKYHDVEFIDHELGSLIFPFATSIIDLNQPIRIDCVVKNISLVLPLSHLACSCSLRQNLYGIRLLS